MATGRAPHDLAAWKTLARAGEAPADVVLRKGYAADLVKAEGDRTYTWTISTASVDRDGDTIQVAGWQTDSFLRAGGPVLWAHNYSALPVGKSPWVRAVGAALKARVEFAPAEVYPFAETVRQLVDFGAIRSTSVGFRPDPGKAVWNDERGGYDFKGQELLEFSLCPVPSNPEALLDAKSAGIDLAPLKAWASDVLDGMEPGLWVPKGQVLDAFKALSETRIVVPALDPEPYVALAKDACTKRGRVLSAANESAIRNAHDGITVAQATLSGVLAQMPMEPPEDEPMEDDGPKPTLCPRSAPAPALYLAPSTEPQKFLVNPTDVAAVVAAAVNEQVRAEVNRARGRLD